MPEPQENKIGAGAFPAALRMGLSEVRAALYAESNIAQRHEPGVWGTAIPSEIDRERRAEPVDTKDAQQPEQPNQPEPEPERD